MNDMSREYAEALFSIACEENTKKEYSAALEMVMEALQETPEYMDFLICPSIPMSERISAVEEAFSGIVPVYIVCFLQLLCEKRHIRLLEECVKEYLRLVDSSEHISWAKVISAVELTDGEKKRLQEKLEKISGQSVIMKFSTDPAIMGGVIIETEGRVIDGSLRRRLQEVKDVIGR